MNNTMNVSLGYADQLLTEVFDGEITGIAVTDQAGEMPSMTIVALARLNRLAQGSYGRGFGPLPDALIAAILSAENLLIPAIDPMAAASPQPSASIQPTRIPTSRLETGFSAAARIASPSGVKRKKTNSSRRTTSVIAIEPISCDDMKRLPNSGSAGNGLGNGLIV